MSSDHPVESTSNREVLTDKDKNQPNGTASTDQSSRHPQPQSHTPPSHPAHPFEGPFHLAPNDSIQQMLEYQQRWSEGNKGERKFKGGSSPRSILQRFDWFFFPCSSSLASLRSSNQSFVAFQDYAANSYDKIVSLHSSRVAKLERLRESLTDIFVRIRQIRMQLHVRTPGLGPYVEDEEAEQEEIEQLKEILKAEALAEQARRSNTDNSESQPTIADKNTNAANTSAASDNDSSTKLSTFDVSPLSEQSSTT